LTLVPKNRLFGACFSEISHDFSGNGRQILVKPHHGSTNAKWRLHIPLDVHKDFLGRLFIEIFSNSGTEKRDWSKPIIIDDSFQHQVVLEKDENFKKFQRKRTILLIDIWNQTLTEPEINDIDHILELLL